ncbi:MAG: 30S ribosomal protein S4 [Proteobacteria bacterium]|nr:30S ribosomal protein S4 [Pseudomonadota bacterium]
MARYTGPVCRFCRREGMKLFLKGERCMTDKCAFERKGYAPGQHGQRRAKVSEYGSQLREKQKVKRVYGLLERQFRLTFEHSVLERGVTSEIFFRNLELRLDNVVFRMGFSRSRNEGRQVVRHNHVLVNGKRCNIPSARLKVGDVVTVAQKSQSKSQFKSSGELFARRLALPWVQVDHGKATGKVVAQPTRDDIGLPVKERLIVELYSK